MDEAAWTDSLVASVCEELSLDRPSADWWSTFHAHLPQGTRRGVAKAVTNGWITLDGWRFAFARGGSRYQFFSRASPHPAPNWEAFVHAAVYGQLCDWLEPLGLHCSGEDHSLDITVRNSSDDLLWYVEVKETRKQIEALAPAIDAYGRGGVPTGPCGKDDALSKAQDLVTHRPPWFSLAAIGSRMDFAVTYPTERSFTLTADTITIPWQQAGNSQDRERR